MATYEVLGMVMKAARVLAGLEQGEVAKLVNVGQQTVSKWENGVSRPRRSQLPAVCSVLSVTMDELVRAGEYEPEVVVSKQRMLTLPFENLADDAFEAFCRDLMSFKYPTRKPTRNGSTGQKQYGIDVFVDGDEERIGIQCKRHKSFGPSDIRKAVAEVLPQARITSGVIALSRRTASADARLEMPKHSAWTLWDGEDLSRMVRELPQDQALTLVDTYFDGLRKDFLGVESPSPWLDPKEYDTALPGRLGFDRDFPLVGRSEQLDQITNLTAGYPEVVLLVGRGGMGKTRLLREFATSDQGRPVRFAAKGPVSPEAYALLPQGAPVVVIDDAMDPEFDLVALVQGVLRERREATIVLSVRPHLVGQLRERLGWTEKDMVDSSVVVGDLSIAEAETLAQEALGDQATVHRVESLAQMGYDCPFLIVLGAHLVRTARMTDHDLQSQRELRNEIVARFADSVVGGANSDSRRAVLSAIAAVQPAPLDEPEFLEGVAAVSRQEPGSVLDVVDELEDLGLIIRRGQRARVIPDLLGDAILERALVSKTGLDKGFAKRLSEQVNGRALTNAIRNVSIIDWHRRSDGTSEHADVLWSTLTTHALELPNTERIKLAKRVAPVAAIYPRHALDLVDAMLNNPAPDEDDPFSAIWGEPRQITTANVRLELAPLIANAGHSNSYMERAMRLLVEIGSRDPRDEHPNPGHALRLMRELGELHPKRPVSSTEAYINALSNMLSDETLSNEHATLISMLKPALAQDLTVTQSKGFSITISKHRVDLDRVAGIRSQAIELATNCLSRGGKRAVASIDVLEEALRSPDRSAPVSSEFSQVIETLRSVLADPQQAAGVRVAAHRALSWHATFGAGERRALAREARKQLHRDDEYYLARVVRSGWATDEDDDEDIDDSDAVARFHRSRQATKEATADIVRRWNARGETTKLLTHIRAAMLDYFEATNKVSAPTELLLQLFETEPDVARKALADDGASSPVADGIIRVAIGSLIEIDDPHAETAAKARIAAGPTQAILVASAIVSSRKPLTNAGETIVRLLIQTDFPDVHAALLSAARWFTSADRGIVLDMLKAAPIDTDTKVANAAAEVLAGGNAVPWQTLTPQERKEFLDRFLATRQLDATSLGDLLNEEIKVDPFSALSFLQRRIEGADRPRKEYEPLPHVDSMNLNFRSSPKLAELVDFTVDWLLEDASWNRQFFGKQILEPMLSGYADAAKSLLRRLVASREEGQIRLASALLDEAPHNFVIREPEFVAELIEDAHQMPARLASVVIAGLHGSAEYTKRSRSIGTDDPEELALREGASAIAQQYPEGSTVCRFYEDVAARASRRIQSEREDDEALRDPRPW